MIGVGWGACFLCTALSPSLPLLTQQSGLESADCSYRRAMAVWTQWLPSCPGEWPVGRTSEKLGRLQRRPWPRTES